MQEDAIWIKQTLAGDKEAFHHLVKKYQSAIYTLILSYTKNPDDAQELTQEVFLESYLDLASLKQHERFYFWLRRIAEYHCQDWLRKRHDDNTELQENIIAKIPSPEDLIIAEETLRKVMQAIDELPKTEKELLKARYLDDTSYTELQAKYGLSYKGVTMRLLRAKEKIRQKMRKFLLGVGMIYQQENKLRIKEGLELMKLTMKIKAVSIGIGVMIIVGTGVMIWHFHQSANNIPDLTIPQTAYSTDSVSHKTISQDSKLSSKNYVAIAKNTANNESSISMDLDNNVGKVDTTSDSTASEKIKQGKTQTQTDSPTEKSELSPEIKEKADLFSKLAPILPELKSMHFGEVNNPARYIELLEKVAEIGQPYTEPALHRTETGKIGGIDTEYMFNLIGLHLGKRLPFDEDSDYFSAKDFSLPGNPEDYPYPW